ncbi:YtxH domain-containing protein [Solibacillus sp. FSL H8-0538]|uniref:YtxH domain-containing protein n=1 Tax=Solibacillus sp. FSL H8-0538 TaxID=2921400 RepID=UPI0030F9EC51
MKAKSLLIGLTAGIVGGAVAVLLTTPQSGEQLRTNLIRNTNSAKEKICDVKYQASAVKQSFSVLSNEAKNNIPNIINELKETFAHFKQDIEPETVILKQEIENLQKSITEIERNLSKNEKNEN